MVKLDDILACIREMAPENLAEPWDNCGLLIASGKVFAESVAVCLDVTHAVADAAINAGADLIVSHHPVIFNPIKRIAADGAQGSLLAKIIRHEIAVYTAHTNADKTYGGLNDLFAGIIGLDAQQSDGGSELPDIFRAGKLQRPMAMDDFFEHVRKRLKLTALSVAIPTGGKTTGAGYFSSAGRMIEKVVVMCGAYSLDCGFIEKINPDALICGEIRYHEALELTDRGIIVVQAGHHETERFFINLIEKWIKDSFPEVRVQGFGFSKPLFSIWRGDI